MAAERGSIAAERGAMAAERGAMAAERGAMAAERGAMAAERGDGGGAWSMAAEHTHLRKRPLPQAVVGEGATSRSDAGGEGPPYGFSQ